MADRGAAAKIGGSNEKAPDGWQKSRKDSET
jgi:hypothetical protein